jgi:hypothetical protein
MTVLIWPELPGMFCFTRLGRLHVVRLLSILVLPRISPENSYNVSLALKLDA